MPSSDSAGERAASIPHATLTARVGDIQGLRVMGAQAGKISYWPSRGGGVLELHDGTLHATAGLPENLLGTRYEGALPWRQDAPYSFRLVRHWQEGDAEVRRGEAHGEMRCANPNTIALPLRSKVLERCMATLDWASGASTTSTFWRDPANRHVWAVRETPWPGGPTIEWQVARHWW